MQKLILLLIFICVMTVGKSSLLFGADQSHAPKPKLDSTQREQSAPPVPVLRQPSVDQPVSTPPSAQKEQEQKEKHCARDLAAVGCEPPLGSPLSASPLASQTNPAPKDDEARVEHEQH
jgi:hypothetical protein